MKALFTIALFIFCSIADGQNLVPNWSFEDTSFCPFTNGQMPAVEDWFSLVGSPDYFHECASPSWVGLPSNFGGHQNAFDGIGYVGASFYNPISVNNREYLAVELTTELESGTVYCISFMVSNGELSEYAISTFGAFFAHDTSFSYNNSLLDTIPQISNDLSYIVADQNQWTEIRGQFVANGGERYMIIGSFCQDSIIALNQQLLSGGTVSAYYFVDGVEVFESSCVADTQLVDIPNVFTPNNDGINDIFRVAIEGYDHGITTIYNRWGQKIYEFNPVRGHWDGYTQAGVQVSEGVYFYSLSCSVKDAEPFVTKGSIQLIR